MEALFLIGMPFSGKTTLRQKLVRKNPRYVVLSTDDTIEQWAKEFDVPYPAIVNSCFTAADTLYYEQAEDAIAAGQNIIVDRTNWRAIGREQILKRLPETGYRRIAIVFDTPEDVLEQRRLHSPKQIPTEILEGMRTGFEPPTPEEFDEIRVISFRPKARGSAVPKGAKLG